MQRLQVPAAVGALALIAGLVCNGPAAWGKEEEEKPVKITAVTVTTVVTKYRLTIQGTNFVPKGKNKLQVTLGGGIGDITSLCATPAPNGDHDRLYAQRRAPRPRHLPPDRGHRPGGSEG